MSHSVVLQLFVPICHHRITLSSFPTSHISIKVYLFLALFLTSVFAKASSAENVSTHVYIWMAIMNYKSNFLYFYGNPSFTFVAAYPPVNA